MSRRRCWFVAGIVCIVSTALVEANIFSPATTAQLTECIDDDEQIAYLSALQGRDDVEACIDVFEGCSLNNHLADGLREICCKTCADIDPNRPAVQTSLPAPDETIQIFLMAGQSECVGQAGASELDADGQGYPELQGDISGVWFAGYASPASADRFFIAPMKAGVERSQFGPEISFGERIYAITGKRTLVMKYCMGGTNTFRHWNPETTENSWDTNADDGTAQWMANNAGMNFSSKKHLFKNMVYTIRRTNEALTNGGIRYEWAGIVWVLGQADLKRGHPIWKTFGENTARLWNGFRQHIGSAVPIIDSGSSPHNQLKSGKEYAIQLVEGCMAKSVEFALSSNDDTASDCVFGPSNACFDSPNLHLNAGPFLYYGYDPAFPECKMMNCQEFNWYRKYPKNLHSGYEGMILKGRMLATAYLREFTSYGLPFEYIFGDPATRFPWKPCEYGTLPSQGNYCWIDYRNESMMIKPASDLCLEEISDDESNESEPTARPAQIRIDDEQPQTVEKENHTSSGNKHLESRLVLGFAVVLIFLS